MFRTQISKIRVMDPDDTAMQKIRVRDRDDTAMQVQNITSEFYSNT